MSERGLRHDVLGRALGDDLAAVDAGGRADVDDVVGRADRVLVVLDDDHGVAEVAQVAQRLEQARVVALVQADRRLVEHVEHAGQARADLRGEADALALAAGERAGIARQRQVVEADVVQEVQALADLLQDAAGDLVLLRGERRGELGEPGVAARIEKSATSAMSSRRSSPPAPRASAARRGRPRRARRRRSGRSPRASRRSRSPSSAARGSG